MVVERRKLYKFHVKNIHSIEIALNNSALAARKAISEKNSPAVKSFVSLNSFLLGAWAENRLRKLLYEKSGLSDEERNIVISQSSQLEKWEKLIEVAFRKHYSVPNAELNAKNLPFSAATRYEALNEILNDNLRSVIEIRNKLAHGQWVYPLNSDGTDIEQGKYQALNQENLPSLQYKKSLITSLADIIHDLVVSLATFDRDFDKNYRKIINTQNNLHNRSYEDYVNKLIDKRNKGIEIRKGKTEIVVDAPSPCFWSKFYNLIITKIKA